MRGHYEVDPKLPRYRVIPIGHQAYVILDGKEAQYVGAVHKSREVADQAAERMNAELKARSLCD